MTSYDNVASVQQILAIQSCTIEGSAYLNSFVVLLLTLDADELELLVDQFLTFFSEVVQFFSEYVKHPQIFSIYPIPYKDMVALEMSYGNLMIENLIIFGACLVVGQRSSSTLSHATLFTNLRMFLTQECTKEGHPKISIWVALLYVCGRGYE